MENETQSKIKKLSISLDEVPNDVYEIILPYLDKPELFSMIQTSSSMYQSFEKLAFENIDVLRLFYLNTVYYKTQRGLIGPRLVNPFDYSDKIPSWPKDISSFKSRFDKLCNLDDEKYIAKYLFDEIEKLNAMVDQKFVVAGGCPFFAMKSDNVKFHQSKFANTLSSDIDIFLIENGRPSSESDDLLKRLLFAVEERIKHLGLEFLIVRFQMNTLTLICKDDKRRDIQFVLRRVHTIEELLLFFDLDCVRFAYDFERVYTTMEGVRSFFMSLNLVGKEHADNGMYCKRAMKYGDRGIETIFVNQSPLNHLHSYRTDLNPDSDWRRDFFGSNIESDIREDDDLYSIMPRLPYDLLLRQYDLGFDVLTEAIETDYGEIDERGIAEEMKKESFTTAKSFSELFFLNCSECFKEGYRDSHLLKKYAISKCYLCDKYGTLNSVENSLCSPCCEKNNSFRSVTRDLSGQVAIVTGARIKIGFTVCLKLLRAGCHVIATTRFTVDALERFQHEKDFDVWKSRLEIYSLNLKSSGSIDTFVEYVKSKHKKLHILINNAAQTVRKPYYLYETLIKKEETLLTSSVSSQTLVVKGKSIENSLDTLKEHLLPEDVKPDRLRLGVDEFGEPFEKNKKNTWKKTLDDVSQQEIMEVQLVNNIAPTLLVRNLSSLMKVTKDDKTHSFVINVTSAEGQFFMQGKTDYHVHNNMSKSALNQLTRSSANYYAQYGILMNSVDTGWISSSTETFKKPPLTLEDGASRILNPIFTNSNLYGHLLKNYVKAPW